MALECKLIINLVLRFFSNGIEKAIVYVAFVGYLHIPTQKEIKFRVI